MADTTARKCGNTMCHDGVRFSAFASRGGYVDGRERWSGRSGGRAVTKERPRPRPPSRPHPLCDTSRRRWPPVVVSPAGVVHPAADGARVWFGRGIPTDLRPATGLVAEGEAATAAAFPAEPGPGRFPPDRDVKRRLLTIVELLVQVHLRRSRGEGQEYDERAGPHLFFSDADRTT